MCPEPRRALRWTPSQRVAHLADADHTVPVGALSAAVIPIDGRPVTLLVSDVRLSRGAVGADDARAAAAAIREATAAARPLVWLLDSDGAALPEGEPAVRANADLLDALASGRAPRIAVCHGLAGGVAAYALALCDVAIAIADRSFVFVAGPAVVKAAIGEDAALDELGGTALHTYRGTLAAALPTDADALDWVRALLRLLSGPTAPVAPRDPTFPALPPPHETWDSDALIHHLADARTWLPLYARFGPSVQVGLARLDGHTTALIVSQPRALGGALDADAAAKVARFLRLAADLDLPVLTLCDTPGFLPGRAQERQRVLVHGADLLRAYADARRRVPTVAVVLRRAVGAGAVLALGSARTLLLPDAVLAQMGDAAAHAAYGTTAAQAPTAPRVDPQDVRAAVLAALGAAP